MDVIKERLDRAYGHLRCAKIQIVPSDDRIICDHVRDALFEVEMAREAWREKSKLHAQMLKACKSARGYFGPSHGPPLCAEDAIGQELKAAITKAEGRD